MREEITPEGSAAPIYAHPESERAEIPDPTAEDPAVESAKLAALAELTGLGVSEAVARTIVGLPNEE